MTPTLAVRCPQCGRRYQCDRRRIGYSILCATPGCQTMIDVKPPVSPWLIASVLGIGAATAVGYSYGRSSHSQAPAAADVTQAPAASAAPTLAKLSPPKTWPSHKRRTDLHTTQAEVDALLRQKSTQDVRQADPPATLAEVGGAITQGKSQEARQADEASASWQRQHTHAAGVSLPTGTDVAPMRGASGMGELTIINGTGQDAVVKLAASTSPGGALSAYRTVYIKAKSQWTMMGIGQGTYGLFFALGDDWDQSAQAFRQNDSYSQFEDPLTFQEKATQSSTGTGYRTGMQYSSITVTLNRVLNGNMNAHPTDKAAFYNLN